MRPRGLGLDGPLGPSIHDTKDIIFGVSMGKFLFFFLEAHVESFCFGW